MAARWQDGNPVLEKHGVNFNVKRIDSRTRDYVRNNRDMLSDNAFAFRVELTISVREVKPRAIATESGFIINLNT